MSARDLSLIALAMVLQLRTLPAQAPSSDSLGLAALQSVAIQRDPRGRELELLSAQTRLRQRNLDAEQLPALSLESQAQYQSDVVKIPIVLPGGISPPVPPRDSYDAHVGAQQRLYDPTLRSRRAVEDAQLGAAKSRVQVALFTVRQNVNDAFFASLRAQSQMAELAASIAGLEAQRTVASTRVREGAALPSEELALRAELLKRRQSRAELAATRRASLEVLSELTGVALDSMTPLALPDLAPEVAASRAALDSVHARPEYEAFARTRELLHQQELGRNAQDKPRISAFGRLGYGRPGLNPLGDRFDSYWLAGVQVQWTPLSWGASDRDREVLALQQQIVRADEQQFTESVRRGVAQDLAMIDRLSAALSEDDEIIALREKIAAETRARFKEGVVTSTELVDRDTDVLRAHIDRASHRVELAQARANFLTTLGLEVRR